MNYWIFKVNPDKYAIDDRLNDPDPNTTWSVTRYTKEIADGDIAFIWRTGKPRGICAVIKIESGPQYMEEIDIERTYSIALDSSEQLRVTGTITHRFPCISHEIVRHIPGLENLSMFRGFQRGTNFRVSPEEGDIIMKLVAQA